MRHLHALGPRGGARRVVDRRGGVLVVARELRGAGAVEQLGIRLRAEYITVPDGDVGDELRVLGVDEQHRRAGVLDDVGDLVAVEPEVDRDEDPTERRDAEERDEEPRRVGRQDRNPFTRADPEVVERDREAPRLRRELAVGGPAEAPARGIGFVDDGHPIGEHGLGPFNEVGDRQRHFHGGPPIATPAAGPSVTDGRTRTPEPAER